MTKTGSLLVETIIYSQAKWLIKLSTIYHQFRSKTVRLRWEKTTVYFRSKERICIMTTY
jgi:hypothetical protein